MLTKKQASRLRYLINKRCIAERNDEMKGAQPPEDRALIEAEAKMAKMELAEFIVNNTRDEGPK